ncbi:MAG: PAS domain-containing protein [Nitrospiraceae bacterium]|nr:MAG: PAS domain-containing protein [Nitrospiraceae bacterium]
MNGKGTNQNSALRSSVRNNLVIAFFLVLAISGVIINFIFSTTIQSHLTAQGLDTATIASISRHFTLIGSGVTIAGVLIVLLLSFLLSDKLTKPLAQLTRGMIDMGNGKWDTTIDIESEDELGQLARGFNFMAAHIREAVCQINASKEYTENILSSVPSILIAMSNEHNVLSANAAFSKLNEQYPQMTVEQFIEPLKEEIQTHIKTGRALKKEITLSPAGSEAILIFSATVSSMGKGSRTDDEERASVLLTLTDVTERRKMKELVLQSRQDWENTFDTIPDMITIHDKNYNIIMANKAAREELHLHLLDFKQTSKCYRHYHGSDSPPAGCPSCNCLVSGDPATFELFEPHLKKFIEIRSIPRFNPGGEMIGLIHIVRDISARKKIEEDHNSLLVAVTKAKIEWEMTFDSALEYIVLINNELQITRCNRSFSRFVKKPVDAIVGNHCYDYFPCSPSQVEDCKNRMSCSQELMTKSELETENGRWLYMSHRPISDERETSMKSVIIATDVTELKSAQKQIRKSEEDLKKKVDDLEHFYDMAVGRELKMKELKKEIERLNRRIRDYEEVNTPE